MQVEGHLLKNIFNKIHHPVIILIGHVYLHHGEFRIMTAVHSLVPEILGKLVNTLVTAHYKPFQVQLIGYTQVQVHVQGIMMGSERTCGSSTRYRLQYRGLNLKISI